jgi:hypothetical protein
MTTIGPPKQYQATGSSASSTIAVSKIKAARTGRIASATRARACSYSAAKTGRKLAASALAESGETDWE